MGILDKIIDVTKSLAVDGDQDRGMLDGLLDIFKDSGVESIVDSFKSKGMGDIISSWIGTGSNMPISSDHIRNALGSGTLRRLAEKVGVSEDNVSEVLKKIMPDIIDKATPDGEID